MGHAVSHHPFPLISREADWVLPVMLAPSFLVMFCYALYWGAAITIPNALAWLTLIGLASLLPVGRAIFRQETTLRRQIYLFCGAVTLIYLQVLLPRLWGWQF